MNDDGRRLEELLAAREKHLGKALSIAHGQPLHIVRGEMQYLFADDGTRYLDLVNNVCHVGHANPRVVAAGANQMALLNTNTRYVYPGLTDYLERLAATLPEPLSVGFLVNSGSEANELALRLARCHTGVRDVVVVEGAYHGNTGQLVDLSPYKFRGPGGAGEPEPWVHVMPLPDVYRGGNRDFVSEAIEVIEQAESDAGIGALLIESMLSCGGQIPLPAGYLAPVFESVRAAGGVCIADEVQVGFGRVGDDMWAFTEHDVIPDIVTMGKPIGNGHPMAAVFTTPEIAASFEEMEFFCTFGGNPVSCATGMAVLDEIEDRDLMGRARDLGGRFIEGLRELQLRHPIIGDVRGRGLFLGFEMVRDSDTLEPAADEAQALVDFMRDRGVLMSTDGPLHNVIKIKPPMVLNEEDVEITLSLLDEGLTSL